MIHDLTWGMRYDAFLEEAWPLIRAHWAEVGSHRDILTLDPDHDRYRALEKAGILHILTARVGQALAGYMFMLVSKHPRDQGAVVATDDIIYVKPPYRRGMLGARLILEAERFAGELGANIVFFRAKARRRNVAYLERYGFEIHEIVYAKVLKAPHAETQKPDKQAAD